MSQMQKDFEVYVWTEPETEQWMLSCYCGDYVYLPFKARWEDWQASRKMLVVDLPEPYSVPCIGDDETDLEWLEGLEAIARAESNMQQICAKAIKSAGIRIKGDS